MWTIMSLVMSVSVFTLLLACSLQLTTCSNGVPSSFDEWSNHLNDDLRSIYHQAAEFAWELSVSPTESVAYELRKFNANKSKWNNARCLEINDFFTAAYQYPLSWVITNVTILNASARLLCNGPKFHEHQADQLTAHLQDMQAIFVNTQICLPKQFDICLNLDRIWEFTYVSRPGNDLHHLNLNAVRPTTIYHKTKLKLFDGYISDDYYLNIVNDANSSVNEKDNNDQMVEQILRSGEMLCLGGEEDFDRIMRGDFCAFNRSDCAIRYNEIFRWAWESWHFAVGNEIAPIYSNAIDLMNIGAKQNGFHDIGNVWKEEVDLPNLDGTIHSLMQQIKPFYQLLHGVLRNILWKQIDKFEPFNRHSTIPAHMLGSMWSQNWQLYQNLILPFDEFNLDDTLKKLNWTSREMVNRADDFYRSLSLPAMTKHFWQNSIFEKTEHFRNCHGTAANMFQTDDYRMIVCAESTLHDLSVIVHEMGHLQYFMAYADQLPIFQDGNAALQESIGDAIFLGMVTPHHLNRLNILPDKYLIPNKPTMFTDSLLSVLHSWKSTKPPLPTYKSNEAVPKENLITVNGVPYPRLSSLNLKTASTSKWTKYNSRMHSHQINDFDLSMLLRMALIKIPQIPFQYIMDAFRWNLFNGTVSMSAANAFYWNLAMHEQGIHPPDWKDRRDYFDLGAKYHTADNTPFMRYFLASFIQAQIFEGLCKVTVFDTVYTNQPLPMPLHRCDIYGSKRAGKLLKKAMHLGTSKHWTEILHMLTGSRQITADALLLYYKPLIVWLGDLVDKFEIPIGW